MTVNTTTAGLSWNGVSSITVWNSRMMHDRHGTPRQTQKKRDNQRKCNPRTRPSRILRLFDTSGRSYISSENTGGKGIAMEKEKRKKERPYRRAMRFSAINQSIAVVRKRPQRNGMTARSWILRACLFLFLLSPNTAQSPTPETETYSPVTSPVEPPETDSPTANLTTDPTARPTSDPTERPTSAPTDPPSSVPSDSPTTIPTTLMPSSSPSDVASESPTLIDSSAPSQGPSLIPSIPPDSPSDRPSKEPSVRPSASPTYMPTSDPTMASSLALQSDLVQVSIFFDDCQKLQGKSIITFESVTAQHIEAELEATSPPLMDLTVGTNIIDQKTAEAIQRGADSVRRNNIRVLQVSPLVIVFDTAVEFRSTSRDHDMPSLIGDAFDTDEDKERLIQSLQATGDAAFSDMTSMRLEINGVESSAADETDETLYIIIGASVGGTLLVVIGAYFFMRGRRKARQEKDVVGTQKTTSLDEKRIQTEIVVDHQDDVSTLGDPMYGSAMLQIPELLEKDETVAGQSFVSGDYEYNKAYGAAGGQRSTATSSGDASGSKRTGLVVFGSELGQDSMLSDDDSFEEQFNGEVLINVIAPAGKLGMVVDTPAGGVPVVHAIKETSVLSSQIKVGDRLLSVDGEDCSGLTALQVSKLISQKAQNPRRALVFSRPRARLLSS